MYTLTCCTYLARHTYHHIQVGLEGGTANVTAIVSTLQAAGVPLSGVWLQDWVGLRHSWDGDRLIWNWEVNYDWYPGWKDMVDGWAAMDTRVLTYINPFFSDPSNFTTQSRHNFYQEGIENGYFVKKADGSPYTMVNTDQNIRVPYICNVDHDMHTAFSNLSNVKIMLCLHLFPP